MNPVELERRLQRIERTLDELASAGRPRIRVGSWTPDMYGATMYGSTTYPDPNVRLGHFVIINHMCWVTVDLYWTSTTATGGMRFSLPFATAIGRPRPAFALRHAEFPYPSGHIISAMALRGVTYFNLIRVQPDGIDTLLNVTSPGYVGVSGMYWIA